MARRQGVCACACVCVCALGLLQLLCEVLGYSVSVWTCCQRTSAQCTVLGCGFAWAAQLLDAGSMQACARLRTAAQGCD